MPAAELREIADPAAALLAQLQLVMRVCSLPPSAVRDERRHLVIRYQRYLLGSRASVFKAELSKLAGGSSDAIPSEADLGVTLRPAGVSAVGASEPLREPVQLRVTYA